VAVVGLHVPVEEPGSCTHSTPGQQSALTVHAPFVGTHVLSARHLLSTHGLPQQSALVAHCVPASGAFTQSTGRTTQRGIPSASFRQHGALTLLQ